MARRRPPRLAPPLYRGIQRYFLTICCDRRRRLLGDHTARGIVLLHLREISIAQGFAVTAYCLMPDHLHLVIESNDDRADLLEFVRLFKQKTSFTWKRQTGTRLWQESFYDHVLRDAESTRAVVRYVLENPVRAGLVQGPAEYEHSGSLVYTRRELIEWTFGWHRAGG